MTPQLAMLLTDVEFFIQDIRAFKTPDDEIDKKLDSFHFQLEAYLMDKSIQKDLDEGKKVFGQMRNPKTGQIEEVRETEVICQMCGKRWLWGLDCEGKSFICPDCEKKPGELRQEELAQERDDEIRAEHGNTFEPMSPKDEPGFYQEQLKVEKK
jgi:hypothetical protein